MPSHGPSEPEWTAARISPAPAGTGRQPGKGERGGGAGEVGLDALRAGQGFNGDMATARKFLDVTDAEMDKLGARIVDAVKEPKDPRALKEMLGGAVRNLGEAGKKRGMTTTLPLALGQLQSRGHPARAGGRPARAARRCSPVQPGQPGEPEGAARGAAQALSADLRPDAFFQSVADRRAERVRLRIGQRPVRR